MTPAEINLVEKNIDMKDIETDQYPLAAKKYYWRMYDLLYYLLTVPEDQHFYILKWFLDPHAPYDPAEKFKDNIAVDPARLPEKPGFYTDSLVKELRKVNEERPLSGYELHYLRTLYKSEVESIDERVGYMIKALENRGLLDKTVIIFTSDHGELFGEHGGIAHGEYFYEPLVNIPLIISGPGIARGKREKSLVSHLDLMPTIKDLAGVNYVDHMKGKSYKALLKEGPSRDRVLYFDRISSDITRSPEADALIMNQYKLIIDKKEGRYVPELYNIREDPGETRDISDENKPLLSEMFKKILEFRKDNQLRLKQNAAKIGKGINLEKETQKTREQLKSLGYL
jgi:arylsulfatase A-like enzyme